MKSNSYKTDIKSVLDTNNNPNYSITNKHWFRESELAEQIKQDTMWVNVLNPDFTLNQRIILIRDNITDFKECLICKSKIKFNQQLHKTSDYCSKSCVTKSTLSTRVLKRRENSKDKKCINYRLLKYPLAGYDYKLKNNKPYNKRMYSRLLGNYLWNEYKNLDLVTKALIKYSKQRIFNIIKSDLSFLIPEYEKEYKLDFNSTEIFRILKFEKEPRLCHHCSAKIITDNQFCSVLCSNQYKSTDETYLANLSDSVKEYYKSADKEEIKDRHNKIKTTLDIFNSNLTSEEKKEKYTNKTLIYDSYDNRKEQFKYLKFLFTEDFYYKNKYLPVECNICGHEWDMTKSTNISRTICRKCNPYKKGKTQNEIFDYIDTLTTCKINDKSLLDDKKEIDILCVDDKLAIEYNGLLYHSFGISKYPIYNNTDIDSRYHLRKTEECENKGFDLFHIFEDEWIDKTKREIWKEIIENKLKLLKQTEHNYIIKEIDKNISSNFLSSNHLKGASIDSDIRFGLYIKNELVSVMEFKNISDNAYEITRFYWKYAKQIIQYFEKIYNPDTITYYSNRRYEFKQDFIKLGFEFKENTEPNCYKFIINKNILEQIDYLDVQKSIKDNYRVIFDCGFSKFVKIKKQL